MKKINTVPSPKTAKAGKYTRSFKSIKLNFIKTLGDKEQIIATLAVTSKANVLLI